METEFASITAPVVFAEVESTGKHSALTSMPLHEAVIARVRVEESGESLIIKDTWPDFAKDVRVGQRSMRDEYARLQRNYGKDMLVSVYGQPHEGRLRKVMVRIYEAFQKGIRPSKIVELGKPDGDFIELPPGASITQAPALVDAIGRDSDDAAKMATATLTDVNASAVTPDGVTDLGDESTPEETPIDGTLIEFLTDNGWNEPQANAVARVVRDKGLQSIADADFAAIQGLRNKESIKAIRQHLNEYRSQKVKTPA